MSVPGGGGTCSRCAAGGGGGDGVVVRRAGHRGGCQGRVGGGRRGLGAPRDVLGSYIMGYKTESIPWGDRLLALVSEHTKN